jgi:hypothetical protein
MAAKLPQAEREVWGPEPPTNNICKCKFAVNNSLDRAMQSCTVGLAFIFAFSKFFIGNSIEKNLIIPKSSMDFSLNHKCTPLFCSSGFRNFPFLGLKNLYRKTPNVF